MRAQGTAPISRADKPAARPSGVASVRGADLSSNFSVEHSDSVAAAVKLRPADQQPVSPGSGLLSTNVQFLLAETRTFEAGAPMPPVSSLGQARNKYLATQAQVRDTITENNLQRGAVPKARPTETEAAAQPIKLGDEI